MTGQKRSSPAAARKFDGGKGQVSGHGGGGARRGADRCGTPPAAATSPTAATSPAAASRRTPSASPDSALTPPTRRAPLFLGSPPSATFASRVAASKEEVDAHRFFTFLERCSIHCKWVPTYVADMGSVKANEYYQLKINFKELRQFDRNLARNVCNNKQRMRTWLLSALRKFLLLHCVDKNMSRDVKDEIRTRIAVHGDILFIDMPESIEKLVDFLIRNEDDLTEYLDIGFEESTSILISSPLGNHIFHSCVSYLLDNHILDSSWNGRFELEDWDLINGAEVELSKPPEYSFKRQYGGQDLAKLDAQLMSFYVKVGKDGKKVVPLYFRELDIDLSVTSKQLESDEDLPWFREYIRWFVGYAPPMARISLIRGIFREIRTYNLDAHPLFRKLLTDPEAFASYGDWTVLISLCTSFVLRNVYWNKLPEDLRKEATPAYTPCLGSCLDYKRNNCEHAEESSRDTQRRQLMRKIFEGEVFAASKIPKSLPFLIKRLLMICLMEGHFTEIWEVYKSACLWYKLRKGLK